MKLFFEIVEEFVPKKSIPILYEWFTKNPFLLRVTRKRVSKYGDFRAATKQLPNRISVNSNLNQYAFLITLTHEFAHLLVWKQHRFKVKAHGIEWKTEFATLIKVLLQNNIFPNHIEIVLQKHIKNPPASSARDVNLIKELKKYDPESNTIYLSSLPDGATFTLNNKRVFIKGQKRRTRYLCKELATKKEYLIHGIAEVTPFEIVNN